MNVHPGDFSKMFNKLLQLLVESILNSSEAPLISTSLTLYVARSVTRHCSMLQRSTEANWDCGPIFFPLWSQVTSSSSQASEDVLLLLCCEHTAGCCFIKWRQSPGRRRTLHPCEGNWVSGSGGGRHALHPRGFQLAAFSYSIFLNM